MNTIKTANKLVLCGFGLAVIVVFLIFWSFRSTTQVGYAEDVQAYFDALNAEGQNSLEQIDAAVANGELDVEMAFIYKIYSVFGDERLPEEYRSLIPFREGTPLVREMNQRWDTLSEESKALLEPYRKRPEEEGSWMNLRFSGSEAAETSWLVPRAHASRVTAYTDFLTSKDGKVKIWYPNVSGMMNNIYNPGTYTVDAVTGKKIAQHIKGFLDGDEIIEDFEELLNQPLMSDGTHGGDSKFDIYVAPCGSDLGLTFAETATPTPSYIIINYGIGLKRDNILKTTLAHELFHAFQYTYDYDTSRDNWWAEATAVWAEDYVYPHLNTEQGWLPRFIPYPMSQADKESPPAEHHYGAYILPFFATQEFGDDFMRKSWEYCDGNKCIDGIDKYMEGGLKKQWKEFTLSNYNLSPANFYMDYGPFPDSSSISSSHAEDIFVSEGDTDIDVEELSPLSADLATTYNTIPGDSKVQKLVFKDLNVFSDHSEGAGIKAIIYYKNGKEAIEDWTKKAKRSFCIANDDENFERIVLIFSNGEKEQRIPASTMKVESKNDCFLIDEEANRTAILHFPYSDGGAMMTTDINTTIDTVARGETEGDAPEDALFGYQTEWKVKYEFEQIKNAFSFSCKGSSVDYEAGWTTRAAGYLTFNLDPNSEGYENNTFPIDMQYGEPHPHGNYEDVPSVNIQCAGLQIGASNIDLSNYKGVSKGIYTGHITEMTPDGAKIEISNCCLYNSCTTQQGAPFQDISAPVILEIKRK